MTLKIRYVLAVPLVALAMLLGMARLASASPSAANRLSYEFDNGVTWTLAKNTAAIHTTVAGAGYADAGVVVDLGPARDFTDLSWAGSGPLAANIWLGDGSESSTPGTHNLADPVDFSYGPWGDTFWTGAQQSHPVTAAQIQTLGDTEVYAWVGVVFTGASVSGSVTSVNGHAIGNRMMSLTDNGDGTITAAVT